MAPFGLMPPTDLPLLAAEYVLAVKRLPPEALPELAMRALEEGHAAASFALLAGSDVRDPAADLRDLFAAAMRESGTPLPGRIDAATYLKVHNAREVAHGRLPPARGVLAILQVFGRSQDELPGATDHPASAFGIAELNVLYDEYESVTLDERRLELEAEMLVECRVIADAAASRH